jgi:hypothetical protein
MSNTRRAMHRILLCILTTSVLVFLVPFETTAKVFLSREEAMEKAFCAGARFDRETIFPSPAQVKRAQDLAGTGVTLTGAPLTRYIVMQKGAVAGFAYLDTHKVRTLRQTVMVFVTTSGALNRIDILTFGEPQEYMARKIWLQQFPDRKLDDELNIGRKIHGMSGATLTAHAVTDASRRVLALHAALEEDGTEKESTP